MADDAHGSPQAAFWYAMGFARALTESSDPRKAYDAGVASILYVTEPGQLDNGAAGWVQKFGAAHTRAPARRAPAHLDACPASLVVYWSAPPYPGHHTTCC